VFILDADEVMPETAAAEFSAVIAGDGLGKAGYWINRRFMFMATGCGTPTIRIGTCGFSSTAPAL